MPLEILGIKIEHAHGLKQSQEDSFAARQPNSPKPCDDSSAVFVHLLASHVGELEITPLKAVGQLRVPQSEQMKNGRV